MYGSVPNTFRLLHLVHAGEMKRHLKYPVRVESLLPQQLLSGIVIIHQQEPAGQAGSVSTVKQVPVSPLHVAPYLLIRFKTLIVIAPHQDV